MTAARTTAARTDRAGQDAAERRARIRALVDQAPPLSLRQAETLTRALRGLATDQLTTQTETRRAAP